MITDAPVVGTGMETKAAVDSGVCVVAKNSGTVIECSSDKIVIKRDDEKDFFCATIVACGLPAFVGGS